MQQPGKRAGEKREEEKREGEEREGEREVVGLLVGMMDSSWCAYNKQLWCFCKGSLHG